MVLEEGDGLHLIKSIQARLDREELLEVFLVMHEVWLTRNNYVFQGSFIPPEQLVLKANSTASSIVDSCKRILVLLG
jgi:hypothetical protein